MRYIFFALLCLAAPLMLLSPAFARQNPASDPISGTWSGDWGPSRFDRNPVTVNLKWDGKILTGNVNPGPNAVAIKNGSFDAKTNTLHMEADARGRGNQILHYVVDGKLDKDTLTGSWNHDNRKGDFKITKK